MIKLGILFLDGNKLTGGPERNLIGRGQVHGYFSSLPLTELNISLRRNFLMFLYGCNLHDLPMHPHAAEVHPHADAAEVVLPHAAAVIGPRSVIKCMSTPYLDRAFMEFIHHTR